LSIQRTEPHKIHHKMNWLNIETATLDSEEFVGSDPLNRATWLCLLRYCAGQENGGIIADCKEWPDRKWQQLARVTKKEIQADSSLWSWSGNDLRLWAYPVERETELQAKREAGRIGGRSKSQAKLEAAIENGFSTTRSTIRSTSQAPHEAEHEAQYEASHEGNGKERKGREDKGIIHTGVSGSDGSLALEIETQEQQPPSKSETQLRAEKLFNRRETTPWGKAELKALKENRASIESTTADDWAALEAFYSFRETSTHCVYTRRDLATALNNWTGEIDKAHRFKKEGPCIKPGAKNMQAPVSGSIQRERDRLNHLSETEGRF
jgi:hypothetical protein